MDIAEQRNAEKGNSSSVVWIAHTDVPLGPDNILKFYSQILIQGTALAIVDFEFSRLPNFCCDILGSVTRPEQFNSMPIFHFSPLLFHNSQNKKNCMSGNAE